MNTLNRRQLAQRIDHTQVRAYATQVDIAELCEEALRYGVSAVCVNPAWTSYCAKRLADSGVRVKSVIGFPLGATTAHIKVEEAREAVRNGASGLDMVVNIGALKSGFPQFVEREIAAVVHAAGQSRVSVIIESSFLTNDEKRVLCAISERAGAACITTSTGYGLAGAVTDDIHLMREVVGDRLDIKAAGGIRTSADVLAVLDAGASHIGTSATADILDNWAAEETP